MQKKIISINSQYSEWMNLFRVFQSLDQFSDKSVSGTKHELLIHLFNFFRKNSPMTQSLSPYLGHSPYHRESTEKSSADYLLKSYLSDQFNCNVSDIALVLNADVLFAQLFQNFEIRSIKYSDDAIKDLDLSVNEKGKLLINIELNSVENISQLIQLLDKAIAQAPFENVYRLLVFTVSINNINAIILPKLKWYSVDNHNELLMRLIKFRGYLAQTPTMFDLAKLVVEIPQIDPFNDSVLVPSVVSAIRTLSGSIKIDNQQSINVMYKSLKEDDVYIQFKQAANTNIKIRHIIDMIEHFERLTLDEKHLFSINTPANQSLFKFSTEKILDCMGQIMEQKFSLIDELTRYELIEENIFLWVQILKPYNKYSLLNIVVALTHTIGPDRLQPLTNIAHTNSGMNAANLAFSCISAQFGESSSVSVGFDPRIYYEIEKIVNINFMAVPLQEVEQPIDVLIIPQISDLIANIDHSAGEPNDINKLLKSMYSRNKLKSKLCVIVDTSLDTFASSRQMGFLNQVSDKILSGELCVFFFRSGHKYDQMGGDKLNFGNLLAYYSSKAFPQIDRILNAHNSKLDESGLDYQGQCLLYDSSISTISKYHNVLIDQNNSVFEQLQSNSVFIFSQRNRAQTCFYISLSFVDKSNKSHYEDSYVIDLINHYLQIISKLKGSPILARDGFGFSSTTLTSIRLGDSKHSLRVSIGLEDDDFKQFFIKLLNKFSNDLEDFIEYTGFTMISEPKIIKRYVHFLLEEAMQLTILKTQKGTIIDPSIQRNLDNLQISLGNEGMRALDPISFFSGLIRINSSKSLCKRRKFIETLVLFIPKLRDFIRKNNGLCTNNKDHQGIILTYLSIIFYASFNRNEKLDQYYDLLYNQISKLKDNNFLINDLMTYFVPSLSNEKLLMEYNRKLHTRLIQLTAKPLEPLDLNSLLPEPLDL